MNQFAERYKKLSNAALLQIIDNSEDYQTEAIEAAKSEFADRLLTGEEFESAKAENDAQSLEKQLKQERFKAFEETTKNIASSITDTLHPIQETSPSTNKVITRISLVLAILFVITLYNELGTIIFTIGNLRARSIWETVLYLVPVILLPVATFWFWQRKKSGWLLLSVFLTYSVLFAVILLYLEVKMRLSGMSTFDNLMPISPEVTSIGRLVFFAACLYFIYKNSVREIYNIDRKNIVVATGIGVLLCLVSMMTA